MPEFTLPEFTRSLRALALPAAPGSGHDRIFAPLIQARAAANRVHAPEAQVAAFDPARLERAWREAIAALAAERHARSAPDRRALEATLGDLALPVWAALERLQAAGGAVRTAPVTARGAHWERWVAAVQRLFEAADDWWGAARLELEGSPAPRRRFWQRKRGKGAR